MSEMPRRLIQFTLSTLFMAVTAVGCSMAATRVLGPIVGAGILLLVIGYWLIEVERFPTPGIHQWGWVAIQAGVIAILVGVIVGA
ncbi:MAG TPA: hypothetical protein VGJ26_17755 [Pirellulales bacterium]|jgi:hypothetical protein